MTSSGGEKGSGTFPIQEFFHPRNHRHVINQTFARGSNRQGSRNANETVAFSRRSACYVSKKSSLAKERLNPVFKAA